MKRSVKLREKVLICVVLFSVWCSFCWICICGLPPLYILLAQVSASYIQYKLFKDYAKCHTIYFFNCDQCIRISMVIGYVLRTIGSFIWNYADSLTSLELLNRSSNEWWPGSAYYVIHRNYTTNNGIFQCSYQSVQCEPKRNVSLPIHSILEGHKSHISKSTIAI